MFTETLEVQKPAMNQRVIVNGSGFLLEVMKMF